MKFGVISDIHIDLMDNGAERIGVALLKETSKRNLDCLLLAGDISENCDVTIPFVKRLREESGISVLYVPGNHDLWNKKNGYSTENIISKLEGDENCLFGKAAVFGNTAVVGHVGWYDYSYGNSELFTPEIFDKKSFEGRTWQDSIYVDHKRTDIEVCGEFNSLLENILDTNADKDIIMITHMLSHPYFLVPSYRGQKWSFFNAFLGNDGLYQLTKKKGVRCAISGHVHYRKNFIQAGVNYVCACLGYEKEWRSETGSIVSLENQVNESMIDFEL